MAGIPGMIRERIIYRHMIKGRKLTNRIIASLLIMAMVMANMGRSVRAEETDTPSVVNSEVLYEIDSLKNSTPGEDYVEDELVMLCDSREEADAAADAYAEALGSEVYVSDYEYGVATLKLGAYTDSGEEEETVKESIEETVEETEEELSQEEEISERETTEVETVEGETSEDESAEDKSTKEEITEEEISAYETVGSEAIEDEIVENVEEQTEESTEDSTEVPTDSSFHPTVLEALELAADSANGLPLVSANAYVSLEQLPVNTDRETFTDPNTKYYKDSTDKTVNSEYQFYHEMIGSKYVWDQLDQGKLNSTDGRNLKESLKDTVVAVIDTGINLQGKDFIRDDGTKVYVDAKCMCGDECHGSDNCYGMDENGHGSNVSGIIADSANELNGRGIAAGVSIMALKVFHGSGAKSTTGSVLKGLKYAIGSRKNYLGVTSSSENDFPNDNVRVINMSLGSVNYNQSWRLMVDEAHDLGIVVCAAAGNYDQSGRYYPAAYDSAISVAAVNSDFVKSSFSNYGKSVDIAAPGGDRAYNQALGADNLYRKDEYIYASGINGIESVRGSGGTSQATPMVSATVALVLAQNPKMSAEDVKRQLQSTAIPVKSDGLGAGCVNVARAMGIDTVDGMALEAAVKVYQMTASGDLHDPEIVKKPVSGEIEMKKSTGIHLESPYQDAVIYYTLNGKTPNPAEAGLDGSDTYIYAGIENVPSTWILYDTDPEKSTVELKAVALRYGNISDLQGLKCLFNLYAVQKISISGDVAEMAVGAQQKVTANIVPLNARNKTVKWTSSDTSIATVSSKGVVTARAECRTNSLGKYIPVTITAEAADGYGAQASYDIIIRPQVSRVEITLENTVLLSAEQDDSVSNTYNLAGKIKIWPENALQKVTYKSSNTRVIKVDEKGLVTAVGSGTAKVTVTAADGSGKKDTQNFKVITPVTDISISDKNTSVTSGMVAAGRTLTPVVTFNKGNSKPDNTTLKWSLEDEYDSDYVKLNTKTGAVTVRSNSALNNTMHSVTIVAFSEEYGIEGRYTFRVYPLTTKLFCKNDDKTAYYEFGSSIAIEQLVGIDDGGSNATMQMFTVTSSNTNIVAVSKSQGRLDELAANAVGYGTTYLTVKALDGSGKSIKVMICVEKTSFTVFLESNVKVTIDSDDSGPVVYYPGKKIKLYGSVNGGINNVLYDWSALNKSKDDKSVYIDISQTGVITGREGAPELTEYNEEWVDLTGSKNGYMKTASVMVEEYPCATSEILFNGISNMDGGIYDGSRINFTRVGQKAAMRISSYPEEACQKYYKYSSSNEAVATVNGSGVITAVHNGTATITIKAGDGSGKKKSIKVVVSQDKAASVSFTEGYMGSAWATGVHMSTIASEAVPHILEISTDNLVVAPETAGRKFLVTSENKRIATVALKEQSSATSEASYIITAVGNGTTYIRFTADDGSGKYIRMKIVVTTPVNEIRIGSSSGSFILKPGKTTTMKSTVNSKASNKSVTWYASDIDESGERLGTNNYATIDAKTGLLRAGNVDATGDMERRVQVWAVANDYDGYVSAPMNVIISTSKVLMKNIQVKSRTNRYEIGANVKLQMDATTTVDATNRQISWSISDVDASGRLIGTEGHSEYATITSNGVVKPRMSMISQVVRVNVTATAKDDSGVSGSRIVTIYPAVKNIHMDSTAVSDVVDGEEVLDFGSGIHDVIIGQNLFIAICASDKTGSTVDPGAPLQEFSITYTTGCGKAYLLNSEGTSVRFRATKKGTAYIYATALDGSGKKVYYKVNVK